VRLIDPALVDQILDQPPYGIVSKGSYNSSFQTEAALQTSGHVVLSPTFPALKGSRSRDSSISRIETQHNFSQAHKIPSAIGFQLDIQGGGSFLRTVLIEEPIL
jgi:hypothetical protein